jgi:hypothetical protein
MELLNYMRCLNLASQRPLHQCSGSGEIAHLGLEYNSQCTQTYHLINFFSRDSVAYILLQHKGVQRQPNKMSRFDQLDFRFRRLSTFLHFEFAPTTPGSCAAVAGASWLVKFRHSFRMVSYELKVRDMFKE